MVEDPDRFSWRLGGDKHAAQEPCKIRHLTLDSTTLGEGGYQLALECQELRSLTWEASFSTRPVRPCVPMDRDLAQSRWPHLQRLCLRHRRPFLADDHLAAILRALGVGHKLGKRAPLKELDATFTGFRTQCAQVLLDELVCIVPAPSRDMNAGQPPLLLPPQVPPSRTGFALESLLLLDTDCSGAYIQRFLCELPTLKRFSGSILTDLEIASDPRPWVCHDLRELNLGFMRSFSRSANEPNSALHGWTAGPILTTFTLPSATGDSLSRGNHSKCFHFPQSFILDRIAALSNLEELIMGMRWNTQNVQLLHFMNAVDPDTEEPHEDWARLAQLKKLRIMECQDINASEARWIIQTWPTSLEGVRVLTWDHVSLPAEALLTTHGIQVIEIEDSNT